MSLLSESWLSALLWSRYCSGTSASAKSLVVATETIKLVYCAFVLTLQDATWVSSWNLGVRRANTRGSYGTRGAIGYGRLRRADCLVL